MREPSDIGSYSSHPIATVNFQIRKMTVQNIVGSRIRTIRRQKGFTQAMLAARCGRLGWDIGENVITKIETGIRCVTDYEILCLARALEVRPESLFPTPDKTKATLAEAFAEKRRS